MAVVTTVASGPLLRSSIGSSPKGEGAPGARVPVPSPQGEGRGQPPAETR